MTYFFKGPSVVQSRAMAGNQDFDQKLERGFREWVRLAPEVATFAGLTEHDGELPRVDRDGVLERAQKLSAWAGEVTRAASAENERADARALDAQAKLIAFERETLRAWESNANALDDLGSLFFVGTFAEYASEDERFEKLASRLAQVPRFLEETRARVTRPEPRWCRVAVEVGEGFPGLLDAFASQSPLVASAALRAKEAATKHTEWCRSKGAGEEHWAIGAERFEELLRLKGLPPLAEVEALGEKLLRELEAERAKIAEEIAPGTWQDAMKIVKREHPASFEEAIGTVRKLVADSRKKVVDAGLCSMPDGETLDVLETPPYLRPLTPFAAIFPAPRFARVQRGIYIVTPTESLDDVHYADLRNVVVHEGYPGHHLQLAYANRRTSIPTSVDLVGFPGYAGVVFAIDLVEGWAHYCELMMKERGWSNAPADRLVLVNDALWRAVRILLDVRLHTGRIGFDEAVAMLREKTGMSLPGATSEVNRYTMSPSYQLSYAVGKHLLLDFRAAWEKKRPGTLREFHDYVLAHGNVPVSWTRASWEIRPVVG